MPICGNDRLNVKGSGGARSALSQVAGLPDEFAEDGIGPRKP
jgi:hypothetical protein